MAGLGIAGNTGIPMQRPDVSEDPKIMLNTYIYNYLLSEGHHDLAKQLLKSELRVNQDRIKRETKTQVNGIDSQADPDSKDENKNRAGNTDISENSLLEYWLIFWDMWNASKTKDAGRDTIGGQFLNVGASSRTDHHLGLADT